MDPAHIKHGTVSNSLQFFQQFFAETDMRAEKLMQKKERPKPRDKFYELLDDKILLVMREYQVLLSIILELFNILYIGFYQQ